jgi:hypothetical protein
MEEARALERDWARERMQQEAAVDAPASGTGLVMRLLSGGGRRHAAAAGAGGAALSVRCRPRRVLLASAPAAGAARRWPR